MSDEELAELEAQLMARLRLIASLNAEAEDMAEQTLAERARRRTPATVHELRC